MVARAEKVAVELDVVRFVVVVAGAPLEVQLADCAGEVVAVVEAVEAQEVKLGAVVGQDPQPIDPHAPRTASPPRPRCPWRGCSS